MSEMSEWIAQMSTSGMLTRPPGEGPFPAPVTRTPDAGIPPPVDTRTPDAPAPDIGLPPGAPAYPGAPPWAGDPSIPAPLEMFLRQYHSGHNVLPQEIYDLYGGDAILESLRKYDPNARWSQADLYGGEGGTGGSGWRLDYDERTLPAPAGPLGWSRPTNAEGQDLFNQEMKYYDPNYGWVTDPRNINHHSNEGWVRYAPYIAAAMSMLAPALAPAAFGALGAAAIPAGFTSAVTGGAAGLGASAIPGAFGAFGGGAPTWWSQLLGKIPRTGGSWLSSLDPPTAPQVSAPKPAAPPVQPPGAAAPPIKRNGMMPDPYGYDPTAFNSGGSAAKPQSNDSKLVATEFADDPYRFS